MGYSFESYLPEPDPDAGEIDPNQLPDTLPGYLIHLTAEFTGDDEVTRSAAAEEPWGQNFTNSWAFTARQIAAAPTIAFSILMTVVMGYLLSLAILFAPIFALIVGVAF